MASSPIHPKQAPIRERDKGRIHILGDIVASAFDDERFEVENDLEQAVDPLTR